ncbi:PAS domain S-box protein [Pontibacter toksunensis]|uniref:Oxygen sensor histidine kinase NreB n=1 Tax=Pontibacter toksunensis TaxID=1332631 RepID=A0ABW6BY03_9BACT
MRKKNAYVDFINAFQEPSALSQLGVQRDYSNLIQVVEAAPDAYLILTPDLRIVLATDAYLTARQCQREELVGKYISDVFPDTPESSLDYFIKSLRASFDKVLGSKKMDQMVLQHYDAHQTTYLAEGLEEKHWIPSNTPVLNEAGEIMYIIHKLTDVTDLFQSKATEKKLLLQQHALKDKLEQLRDVEQKLKDAQQRLEETQTLGHIGSFEATFPYDDIRWSDELFRIHGLEPQSEKILFETCASFVHPDDREAFDKTLAAYYTEQKELNFIYRIVRSDEAVRVLHVIGRIVYTLSGKAHKVHGTIQDITEQVKAEQKIRENEALLSQTEKIGRVGSYSCDIATMQLQFSDGMFRLLGYEPGSFVPTLDFIDSVSQPDDALVVRQILEQAAKTKQPYEYLRRIYRPNGKMFYMHSIGRVECDSEGNAKRFIGIVHDITERQQAEEKLRQSEFHYRMLVSNTPDIITRWREDLELVFSNQHFEAVTGLPVTSLYLKAAPEAEKQEGSSLSWKEKVGLVMEMGEPLDHNHSYDLPFGRAYYHSRLVPEYADDGTIKSVLVIARDISALKKLEQENLNLRLSQQKDLLLAIMETQETERRRIAEALHSGIGQLLYGAKLNLDQLTRVKVAQDASKIKATVLKTDQMLHEAIKQVRTISHELTPSVLEHFGLEVAFQQMCVPFNTEDMELQCEVFNLRQDVERHLQVCVYRIAQELVNNIIKHAEATKASLLMREQKDSLVLLAEDNGKGFAPEQIQTEGIGLKSIQDRVKLLNGTMRIHSAPNQGTLVQITLPLGPVPGRGLHRKRL